MLPRLRTGLRRPNYLRACSSAFRTTEVLQSVAARKTKDASAEFEIGNEYHNFLCVDKQRIEEFNMTAIVLQHTGTKTEYLHVDRDDPNNVFSINFRTTPFSSAGTPHILEHSVLCGSRKYPVRDPFFKMLNRSLATFMNAMTGPDYTFYPFSSQNEVDYRNLQSIYLDAVFNPNLAYLDFLQEGWRLEYSDLSDRKSDIIFKGVVFNEMKGAFSETTQLFGQKFINGILPEGTYGHVSGGDPLKIPDLTHDRLKQFHGLYYHPSNARIYSYGNFPLAKNLQIVDAFYLSKYEYEDPSYSIVNPQTRWEKPRSMEINCRFDKMGAPIEKQNQIAIGLVMNDIKDVYETFQMQLLSELMLIGPNSTFYKRLIEPNISGGYSSMTGYDPQMRDTLFTVGLQDIEPDNFDKVSKIFDRTISEIIDRGFEKDHIASVLHSVELAIKHQTTKFGLNMLFNLTALWNHDASTVTAMKVGDFLNTLKSNLRNDPRYLNKVVEKYFGDNNHRLTMTMRPAQDFESVFAEEEAQLLKSKVTSLTQSEKDVIFEQGKKLAEAQKKIEDVNILPCLSIDDINITRKAPQLKHFTCGIVPLQYCEANTNGVTYFRGVLDISRLPDDLKMLTPLFNDVVSKFSTDKYTYQDLDRLIGLKTGGIGFSNHFAERLDNPSVYEQGILINSHCLDENATSMFEIWEEMFKKPKFDDVERFKMLLSNYASSLTPGLVQSGHHYAMQMAQSLVSPAGELREKLGGVTHIVHTLNSSKVRSAEDILGDISEIASKVLDRNALRAVINVSKNNNIVDIASKFLSNLPQSEAKDTTNRASWTDCTNSNFEIGTVGAHVSMTLPVNYCAASIPTVPFAHGDYAKLKVLARFLSLKYLHPIVREQNGAYGSGAAQSNGGLFQFYSYRDPNSTKTFDIFDETPSWLKDNSKTLDEQALFEAKLGVLQQVDAPVAEHSQGLSDFLQGFDYDAWCKHRSAILTVTRDDCIDVAQRYLGRGGRKGKCIIGPGSEDIHKQNDEKWNVITGPN